MLGVATSIGDWFGVGFPFLSRGWWAGWSFYPKCWALFSFYVTLLLVTLTTFTCVRVVPAAVRRTFGKGSGKGNGN